MVKKELSETEIAESIPDLWQPLTDAQRDYLAQNFTIQKYKKNETIYCEGETPKHLMCLLKGKVKIKILLPQQLHSSLAQYVLYQ